MQLSSMIDAGLSVEHALKTIYKHPKNKHKKYQKNRNQQTLKRIIQRVSKGSTLTAALKENSVVDKFDAALLENAEISGRLPQGLSHISKLKLIRQKMIKTLSGMALLPKAILFIGALAGIFVRIFQQGQTAIQAITDVSIVIVFTLIGIKLAVSLLTVNARIPISLGWDIPLIKKYSKAFQQHFEQRFYHSFTWQLASGIDSANAIQNNALLLNNINYKKTVSQAAQLANKGIALPILLEQNNLALSARMQQTLSLSNTAGTAEKAISHELTLIQKEIKQRTYNIIAWWPRALYVVVMLIILKYIF